MSKDDKVTAKQPLPKPDPDIMDVFEASQEPPTHTAAGSPTKGPIRGVSKDSGKK